MAPLIPYTPRIPCPGQIEHRKERLRVGCGDSCAMIRLTLLSRPIDIQMIFGCGPASRTLLYGSAEGQEFVMTPLWRPIRT